MENHLSTNIATMILFLFGEAFFCSEFQFIFHCLISFWEMIPCSRLKLSDVCTPFQAKLLENYTLHSSRYSYSLYTPPPPPTNVLNGHQLLGSLNFLFIFTVRPTCISRPSIKRTLMRVLMVYA